MLEFLRRLRRDQRGVSALEFAFIAPVMIFFYMGLAETAQAIMAERRNVHVASAIGDLVTQSAQTSNDEVDDIFLIAKTIMEPYSTDDDLDMRITSIVPDAKGKPVVDWSRGYGDLHTIKQGESVTGLDDPPAAGESVVRAESTYTYKSPIAHYISKDGIVFSETIYLKPRKSSKVMKP